uniref:Progestin and adipoQ receptor family member VI n=1 Tax=Neogobius melanostomus TaxID=47308 RepID=A0A8C6TYL8_9GOBI
KPCGLCAVFPVWRGIWARGGSGGRWTEAWERYLRWDSPSAGRGVGPLWLMLCQGGRDRLSQVCERGRGAIGLNSHLRTAGPPLYHIHQVPKVVQEDGIISGYRDPCSTALDCVLSSFQIHNETINIWTHFLPTWYFAWRLAALCSSLDFVMDPYSWPLLVYMLLICVYPFTSSCAHTFSAMSTETYHICFFFDYGALSLYSLGCAISYGHYVMPECWVNSSLQHCFVPVALLNSVFCTSCLLLPSPPGAFPPTPLLPRPSHLTTGGEALSTLHPQALSHHRRHSLHLTPQEALSTLHPHSTLSPHRRHSLHPQGASLHLTPGHLYLTHRRRSLHSPQEALSTLHSQEALSTLHHRSTLYTHSQEALSTSPHSHSPQEALSTLHPQEALSTLHHRRHSLHLTHRRHSLHSPQEALSTLHPQEASLHFTHRRPLYTSLTGGTLYTSPQEALSTLPPTEALSTLHPQSALYTSPTGGTLYTSLTGGTLYTHSQEHSLHFTPQEALSTFTTGGALYTSPRRPPSTEALL